MQDALQEPAERSPPMRKTLCVEHDLSTFSSAQTGSLQDSVDVIGRKGICQGQ